MKRQHQTSVSDYDHSKRDTNLQTNPAHYANFSFPNFAKPTEVGCISIDENSRLSWDKRQLKYCRAPSKEITVDFDLNSGYEQWKPSEKSDKEKIEANEVLKWVLAQSTETQGDLKSAVKGADFVCWRGLLTRIASTPYENRDPWKLAIIFHKGVYFLFEFTTEAKAEQLKNRTERENVMSFWGFKLEQYLVSDQPNGKPNTKPPINNRASFSTVVRSKLGDHRLLFAGEVDCLDPDTNCYLEIKTNRFFGNKRQEENFHRFKTVKWWLQSFLCGISTIIVGFRNDSGVVKTLKSMDLKELAKNPLRQFKPEVCMGFLNEFFTYVRQRITDDNSDRVFLIEYSPPQTSLSLREVYGEEREMYHFLPDWFNKV